MLSRSLMKLGGVKMIRSETTTLLAELAAIDNRQVTKLSVDAWHPVVAHLEYSVARRAVAAARGDASIAYIEPKHVLLFARIVMDGDERAVRRMLPPPPAGVQAPRPANFDAMIAAADDPVAFSAQVAIYNEQLAAAGCEPVYERFAPEGAES
jgi:hypothetical protein